MTTKTDVVRQVAEAKCPWCAGSTMDGYVIEDAGLKAARGTCKYCQGTGLRWPTLSRECREYHVKEAGTYNPAREKPTATHQQAGCSGRIPDVSTDKVLDIVEALGRPVLRKLTDGTWILDIWTSERESITGTGATYDEALATALLETV